MLDGSVEKVREAWETNAAFWDDYIGPEGNAFHRELIAPSQLRLLALKEGERVLDVACGNGQFAREMARHGASVLAVDLSQTFLDRASKHTDAAGITNVEYRPVDATDEQALRALGNNDFDAAVCTMALMDIPTIEPLLSALPSLLRPVGRFVFSVPHPCFNSMGAHMYVEQDDRSGELVTTYGVKVDAYLDIPPEAGLGIVGQPVPNPIFHRPISELFQTCFRHGFVLDGIEEPAHAAAEPSADRLRWRNYTQLPPVLVARMVLR